MPALTTSLNPYPGLRPFGEADHEFFFGREQEIDELITRLSVQRFLAVLGVSGCGKSSLIQAGLIPVLQSGLAEPLSGDWKIYSLRPGGDPLKFLQQAVGSDLPHQSHALRSWARSQNPNNNILVFVDQFEEIFPYRNKTLAHDGGNEASLFVDLLITAASDPAVPLFVVLTMRTDYLGECAVFRGFSEALSGGSYLVPRLSRLRQQEAIERPAAALGVKAQPGLVQRLLNDSEGDPDKLPVLQHLIKVLWERRLLELNLELYDTVGGWQQALAKDAEDILSRFPQEQGGIRQMLQWLGDAGTGGRPVRRRVPVVELSQVTGLSPQRVDKILEAFSERGFLRCESDGLVDFTHESVMWQWPKLHQWIMDENEAAMRIRFLQEGTRQKQFLTDSALANAEVFADRARSSPKWVSRYIPDPAELQVLLDWISSSKQRQERELAVIEERRHREESRRRTLMKLGLTLFVVTLVAAISLWINYSSVSRHNSELKIVNTKLFDAESKAAGLNMKLNDALQQNNEDRRVSSSARMARGYLKTIIENGPIARPNVTVQYFAKQSELSANPELVSMWKDLGFHVQISKPNFELPSNKIWFGSQVDQRSVQSVAYSLLTYGFAIRQIGTLAESGLDKGHEHVIQVGWSNQAENLPLLTPSDIQKFAPKR